MSFFQGLAEGGVAGFKLGEKWHDNSRDWALRKGLTQLDEEPAVTPLIPEGGDAPTAWQLGDQPYVEEPPEYLVTAHQAERRAALREKFGDTEAAELDRARAQTLRQKGKAEYRNGLTRRLQGLRYDDNGLPLSADEVLSDPNRASQVLDVLNSPVFDDIRNQGGGDGTIKRAAGFRRDPRTGQFVLELDVIDPKTGAIVGRGPLTQNRSSDGGDRVVPFTGEQALGLIDDQMRGGSAAYAKYDTAARGLRGQRGLIDRMVPEGYYAPDVAPSRSELPPNAGAGVPPERSVPLTQGLGAQPPAPSAPLSVSGTQRGLAAERDRLQAIPESTAPRAMAMRAGYDSLAEVKERISLLDAAIEQQGTRYRDVGEEWMYKEAPIEAYGDADAAGARIQALQDLRKSVGVQAIPVPAGLAGVGPQLEDTAGASSPELKAVGFNSVEELDAEIQRARQIRKGLSAATPVWEGGEEAPAPDSIEAAIAREEAQGLGGGGAVAGAPGAEGPAPESARLAPQEERILGLIRKHEAAGSYYVGNGGTPMPKGLTLDEAIAWGKQNRANGAESTAIGAYQFINKTITGLKEELGLRGDEPFTPQLQDRLAQQLLKRRGFYDPNISKEQLAENLANEWSSLPLASGESAHKGIGSNRALVGYDEFTSHLDPRTAGLSAGHGPAVSPHALPDRQARDRREAAITAAALGMKPGGVEDWGRFIDTGTTAAPKAPSLSEQTDYLKYLDERADVTGKRAREEQGDRTKQQMDSLKLLDQFIDTSMPELKDAERAVERGRVAGSIQATSEIWGVPLEANAVPSMRQAKSRTDAINESNTPSLFNLFSSGTQYDNYSVGMALGMGAMGNAPEAEVRNKVLTPLDSLVANDDVEDQGQLADAATMLSVLADDRFGALSPTEARRVTALAVKGGVHPIAVSTMAEFAKEQGVKLTAENFYSIYQQVLEEMQRQAAGG